MPRDVHDIKRQIVVDKRFEDIIKCLKSIKLPDSPNYLDLTPMTDIVPEGKVIKMEEKNAYDMSVDNGLKLAIDSSTAICAYDESIAAYEALEGHAVCVSHALVYVCPDDYIPINYITLRFFTRSSAIGEKMGESAIVAENTSHASMICIAKDKIDFLEENCIDNSILLVDGPLIAGDGYTTFLPQIKRFCERNILSAFFVKNSRSNMVVDYVTELKGKYNSDMHWANEVLKPGQRSSFFEYTDSNNAENSKVFCYMKFFNNTAPVRLEFPKRIYIQFESTINNIVDLAYYLLLVQGDKKNPQIRPIAVAEKFARETLKVIDVNKEIRKAGLIPTMNENRWGEL